MTALVCAKIIKTVGQSQSLRVSQALVHLFYTTVNISAYRVNMSYGFTLQRNTQTQCSVSRRVLRTEVDYIIVIVEQHISRVLDGSVVVKFKLLSLIGIFFIGKNQRIRVHIVILAEWIAYPVFAKEQSTHIWMSYEYYTEEIVYLAFFNLSCTPQVIYCRQYGVFTVGGFCT